METKRLDLDQLMYLTDEDKNRYSKLETLFAQEGWQLLVELAQKLAVEAHNRAANAASWDQNRVNLGLRMAYEHIATIEQATHNEYIELADSNRQRVLEAEIGDEIGHQT